MAISKPKGIIDDIFKPLGSAAVHEVRQAVRTFVRHEHNLKPKIIKNTKSVKAIGKVEGNMSKINSGRASRQGLRLEDSRSTARAYFKSDASFSRAVKEERGVMGLNPKVVKPRATTKPKNVKK